VLLDEHALVILKIKAGDRVELRRVATSVRPKIELLEAAE
jgi:hypothetical protein